MSQNVRDGKKNPRKEQVAGGGIHLCRRSQPAAAQSRVNFRQIGGPGYQTAENINPIELDAPGYNCLIQSFAFSLRT